MHSEIVREHPDADVLVLFIHGIMGSPAQFDAWANACYGAGYSCVSILLPGHGEDGRGFARSGQAAWERHVSEALERHQGKYRRVVCVGHSMGGLLALNESLRPGHRIAGVFMIAPPVQINLQPWSVRARLRMVTMDKNTELWRNYMRVYGVGKTPIYVFPLFAGPLVSLKRLIEKTKRNLSKVTVPVFVVHSTADETVSFKSARSLDVGLNKAPHELMRVDHAWHAYYPEEDTQKIGQALMRFIERVTRP